MPKKGSQGGARRGSKTTVGDGEIRESRSVSSFFGEHQAIAGFESLVRIRRISYLSFRCYHHHSRRARHIFVVFFRECRKM